MGRGWGMVLVLVLVCYEYGYASEVNGLMEIQME